jgi:dolichyl-phosphate-mannose--protein O-mannosyl transferase
MLGQGGMKCWGAMLGFLRFYVLWVLTCVATPSTGKYFMHLVLRVYTYIHTHTHTHTQRIESIHIHIHIEPYLRRHPIHREVLHALGHRSTPAL